MRSLIAMLGFVPYMLAAEGRGNGHTPKELASRIKSDHERYNEDQARVAQDLENGDIPAAQADADDAVAAARDAALAAREAVGTGQAEDVAEELENMNDEEDAAGVRRAEQILNQE